MQYNKFLTVNLFVLAGNIMVMLRLLKILSFSQKFSNWKTFPD